MSAEQTQAAAETTTETVDAPNVLDQILTATRAQTDTEKDRVKGYFEEYLKHVVQSDGKAVSKDVEKTIKYWIAEIDKKLSSQLNEVLHNPVFQKLESTWRGLHYLVMNSETGTTLKIRVLNVTKKELFKDLEKAAEFDQSQLFKKIYTEEFDQLGGEPFGMLVGDYEFGRGAEDISLLKMISGVAAAAHAPFVSAAAPTLFDMKSYTELSNPRDLAKIFDSVEYASWKSFRESEDSRYVALTLPRVLARLPYGENFRSVAEFNYEENVDGKDHEKYLWMNASWAYATRITDAYAKYGWMARTRGVEGGGRVEGLPVHTFPSDEGDVAMKCPTEIAISERREFELSNLGFLPLLHCKGRDFAVFMGAQSCQKPAKYDTPEANANSELSAKFNLIMCNSRFAHYLKVMARDWVGSFTNVQDMTSRLNRWINGYCVNPNGASEEMLAQRPLSSAKIEVRDVAGKPGHYEAVAWLKPHFQLETLTTSMRLVAEIPQGKG